MAAHRGPEAAIERIVEWVDTDAAGHHHNSSIVRWVEAAEATLMRELGLPEYFPVAPRVQQVVNFRGKLWFGQRVTTTVWIERVGRTSLVLGFEVLGESCRQSPGGLAAEGTITTAHVPLGAERAAPWPDPMRATLEGAGR